MTLLIILSIQICLWLVGYLLAVIFGVKNKLEAFGLAYLIGSGVVSIVFLVIHWLFWFKLGPDNFIVSLLLVGGIAALVLFLSKKTSVLVDFKWEKIVNFLKRMTLFEKILALFLLVLIS